MEASMVFTIAGNIDQWKPAIRLWQTDENEKRLESTVSTSHVLKNWHLEQPQSQPQWTS
jgi:hypothetical protein